MPYCGSCKWFCDGPATTWEFYQSQPASMRSSKTAFCALLGPMPCYSNVSHVTASWCDRPTEKNHPACERYEPVGKG